MNILKICFLAVALCVVSPTNAALQTLRVAVIFDSASTSYTTAEKNTITSNLINNLNTSFKNSGLQKYINFTLAISTQLYISNAGDTFEILQARYLNNPSLQNGVKTARLPLHTVQKNYTADVVIGIVTPSNWLTTSICGTSITIPNTSQFNTTFPNATTLLKKGDDGIIFLNSRASCLDKVYLAAHEVGHTFGLHHGYTVAMYTGDFGNYPSNIFIATGASGYGKAGTSSYDYGTIMAAYNLGLSEAKKDNRFSDKTAYKCGALDNQICGEYNANAVSVIKTYAASYNQRGVWYTY